MFSIAKTTQNLVVFASLFLLINGIYNEWIDGDYIFNRSSGGCTFERSVIGYDEDIDTIWLLGGWDSTNQGVERQLMSFSDGIFTDHGIQNLTILHDIQAHAQSYTQIGDILWILHKTEAFIYRYNLKTLRFENPDITVPVSSYQRGCMTTINDTYLIIAGGGRGDTYLDLLQVFNLISSEWLDSSNIPKLKQKRRSSTCNVNNNKLYVIGGNSDEGILGSVEVFNITKWEYIGNLTLIQSVSGARSVVFEHDILILGGYEKTPQNSVQILDTITDTIWGGEDLLHAADTAPSIIVNEKLYLFYDQNWQYLLLYTINPTINPTALTEYPTEIPSLNPSEYPTLNPTKSDHTIYTTIESTVNSVIEQNEHEQDNSSSTTAIIIVTCIVMSILIITIIICYKRYYVIKRTRVHNQTEKPLGIEMNEMEIVEMDTDVKETDIDCIGSETEIIEPPGSPKMSDDLFTKKETCGDTEVNAVHHNEPTKIWFESTLCLPEYYELFVENGYETLGIIAEIDNKKEIIEIGEGIKKGHAIKIWNEVKILKEFKTNANVKKDGHCSEEEGRCDNYTGG
eukprot:328607_1